MAEELVVIRISAPLWSIRLLLWAMLAAGSGLANAESVEAAYRIEPCANPVRVQIRGVPQLDELLLRQDYISCGKRTLHAMEHLNILRVDLAPSESPKLAILSDKNRIDVELEVPTSAGLQRFHARQLKPNDAWVALTTSPSVQTLPQVRVSRLSDQTYVSLHVLNGSSTAILADLVKLTQLKVRALTPLPEIQLSLRFEIIPTDHALGFLADVSDFILQRDDNGGYTLGRMWHHDEITALRARLETLDASKEGDRASRTQLLEQIVALARNPGPENQLPPRIAYELEELVKLAVDTNNPKRAELFSKQWMAEIERQRHTDRPVEYARAQIELARARLNQNDASGAAKLFSLALPVLTTDRTLDNLPLEAEVWSQLALIELSAGRMETARASADHAYALLSSQESKALEQWQCDMAYRYAMQAYAELSTVMRERDNAIAAHADLSRVLELGLRNEVEEDVRLKFLLEMQMQSALTLGRYTDAVNLAERQLQRADRFSQGDAGTALALVVRVSALVAEGDFVLSVASWETVVEQRRVWYGDGSAQHRNALAALVMLHRLAHRDERAAAIEQQLAALMRDLPSPVPPPEVPSEIAYAASYDLAQILLDTMAENPSTPSAHTLAQAQQMEQRAEALIAQRSEHIALPVLSQALAIRRQLQGDQHADTKRLLARIEMLAKRAESAR